MQIECRSQLWSGGDLNVVPPACPGPMSLLVKGQSLTPATPTTVTLRFTDWFSNLPYWLIPPPSPLLKLLWIIWNEIAGRGLVVGGRKRHLVSALGLLYTECPLAAITFSQSNYNGGKDAIAWVGHFEFLKNKINMLCKIASKTCNAEIANEKNNMHSGQGNSFSLKARNN